MNSRYLSAALMCGLTLATIACDGKASKGTGAVVPPKAHDSAAAPTTPPAPQGAQLGSREGHFNVQFPAGFTPPQQQEMQVETPAGKLPMTIYTSAQDTSSAYMVAYVDYPEQAFDAGIEPMLNGAREGALKDLLNATIVRQDSVSLNGHPGLSIVFNGSKSDKKVYGRADFYLARPRLYELLFLTSDSSKLAAPGIADCFHSFAIATDTTATAGHADSVKK